ncbi:MAG: amidase [Acidobacteria bacterium]|nr:MAG: amidase [Acidobacteriota bacterium]
MTTGWCDHPIHRLATAIDTRAVSVREVVEATLTRIADRDRSLRAFTTVLGDSARVDAEGADREITAGRYRGPLHGVPVSIKDLIDVVGVPTTAASRVTGRAPAGSDAPVVARLRAAGAILIGKCNLHEFAFGTTGEDSSFGQTLHPCDPTRSPGGSSGGSAVSVAAGMAFATLGTDTGGSIRIPAAACGLVGLKPTFGEVSCHGVVPLAPSLDHVGPLTRCVRDARIVFHAIRDRQEVESASTHGAVRTLGCPRPYFLDRLDDEVRAVFERALSRLSDADWTVEDTPVQHAHDAATISLHLVLPEAAAMHAATLEQQPQDYTPAVRLRLELGRYVRAEDYVRAQHGRAVLGRAVDAALAGRAALVLPSLAIPAPPLGATTVEVGGETASLRGVMLRLTQLFNATGHPAVSIPCGLTSTGLPCGLQLVGHRHQTDHLLDVAEAVETALAG